MLEQKTYKQRNLVLQCEECGNNIKHKPSEPRRFCSRTCWKVFYKRLRTFICTGCNKVFETKPGEKKPDRRPFCSRFCWDKFQVGSNNPSYKGSSTTIKCLQCDNEFRIKTVKRRKTAKFCSHNCRREYYNANGWPKDIKIIINCNYCNKPLMINPNLYKEKRPFCNKECASKRHSFHISGKNNGRYKHGNSISLYGPGWTKTHKAHVRERDAHCCQICNRQSEKSESSLHVHHIDHNKTNLAVNNLITLCKFCHRKMHAKKTEKEWQVKLLNPLKK